MVLAVTPTVTTPLVNDQPSNLTVEQLMTMVQDIDPTRETLVPLFKLKKLVESKIDEAGKAQQKYNTYKQYGILPKFRSEITIRRTTRQKDIAIGEVVELKDGRIGRKRWFNKTYFAVGKYLGLELLNCKGSNNGTVQKHQYFECPENAGKFVKATAVRFVLEEFTDEYLRERALVYEKFRDYAKLFKAVKTPMVDPGRQRKHVQKVWPWQCYRSFDPKKIFDLANSWDTQKLLPILEPLITCTHLEFDLPPPVVIEIILFCADPTAVIDDQADLRYLKKNQRNKKKETKPKKKVQELRHKCPHCGSRFKSLQQHYRRSCKGRR